MHIAIIDNFDSFTYNLVHIVEQHCKTCSVMRNNNVDWKTLDIADKIIFSPGPGVPSDVPVMGEILNRYANIKPIFGVCLGMQYIGEYFGAQLMNLTEIMHGVPKATMITDSAELIFQHIPTPFNSGRYHSWAIDHQNFPSDLVITAVDHREVIMAIRHKTLDVCGVQFHPESVLTQYGTQLLKNWVLA